MKALEAQIAALLMQEFVLPNIYLLQTKGTHGGTQGLPSVLIATPYLSLIHI